MDHITQNIGIQEAIKRHIAKNENVSPADIVNELIPRFYPLSDPSSDISFELVLDAIKYYTTIINCDDMCVEQSVLYKYKVLYMRKSKSGFIEDRTDVKRVLETCKGLVDGIDYKVQYVPCRDRNNHLTQTLKYIMTPDTFFMCLVRSKNSSIYAEYYLHVLRIYHYYEKYFTKMYKEKLEILSNQSTPLTFTSPDVNVTDIADSSQLLEMEARLREQIEQNNLQIQSKLDIIQVLLLKHNINRTITPPATPRMRITSG